MARSRYRFSLSRYDVVGYVRDVAERVKKITYISKTKNEALKIRDGALTLMRAKIHRVSMLPKTIQTERSEAAPAEGRCR
jgi:hypothetical protein